MSEEDDLGHPEGGREGGEGGGLAFPARLPQAPGRAGQETWGLEDLSRLCLLEAQGGKH